MAASLRWRSSRSKAMGVSHLRIGARGISYCRKSAWGELNFSLMVPAEIAKVCDSQCLRQRCARMERNGLKRRPTRRLKEVEYTQATLPLPQVAGLPTSRGFVRSAI